MAKAEAVPIPKLAVKPLSADGTCWATGWESRTLPGSNFEPGLIEILVFAMFLRKLLCLKNPDLRNRIRFFVFIVNQD
ncbi:MAG TPA: hypothetical protein GXZ98_00735 [Firmicutes bacterium]|jgi:hypothetical protein|nr:hypothetical protein [Bacillota bacterium]